MNLTERIADDYEFKLTEADLCEAIDLYDEGLSKTVELGKIQMEFSLYTWIIRNFAEANPLFNVYSLGGVRGKILNQFYSDIAMEQRREAYNKKWGRYPKW